MSQSCPMAVSLYKTVAEKGDWQYSPIPIAYQAYKRGDYETALLAYLQAADMGYEVAQANVAWLLDQRRHGYLKLTVPYSRVALIYWMRSANQGNTDARVKTGDYYYYGIGTKANQTLAAKCYRSVAKTEASPLAMWNLGWMHEHGIGVVKASSHPIFFFYLLKKILTMS
jgi:SEL1 protein